MNQTYVSFDEAFRRLVGSEGDRLDLTRGDRGNWDTGIVGKGTLKGSKFGISAMTYPDLDIKNLTLAQAKAIYLRDWWIKAGGDDFEGAIVFQLWDMAVNTGMDAAKRALQRAAMVAADGDIGPGTRRAVKAMSVTDVIYRFNAARIRYYSSLKAARDNLGWFNRVADRLDDAATDT